MIRALFLILISASTSSAFILAPPSVRSSSELAQTLVHDAEAGKGASWAGARFGDTFLTTGQHYIPSETHGSRSTNAMDLPSSTTSPSRSHHYTRSSTHERANKNEYTSPWVSGKHAEAGNGRFEWSGARRGDYGYAPPTASQWLE